MVYLDKHKKGEFLRSFGEAEERALREGSTTALEEFREELHEVAEYVSIMEHLISQKAHIEEETGYLPEVNEGFQMVAEIIKFEHTDILRNKHDYDDEIEAYIEANILENLDDARRKIYDMDEMIQEVKKRI